MDAAVIDYTPTKALAQANEIPSNDWNADLCVFLCSSV
jgi:hypothetical protein